jgi:hypothetical protein
VLKVWSKRHRDLGRTRTQVACRLHAVLCELIAGGVAKEITAGHAAQLLEAITPAGAVQAAAASSPPRSAMTCAASTPSCSIPRRSSPLRCALRAPP